MKKILILIIALLSINGVCEAQKYMTMTSTGQNIWFRVYGDYAIITYPGNNSSSPYNGFTEPAGIMIIPDSVELSGLKYPVKYIDNRSFSECGYLTSVTLPDAVRTIGDHAFYNCANLSSINMPASITYINTSAFEYCTSLQAVIFPNAPINISYHAFNHSGIRSLTIPDSVESIQSDAFSNCDSLTYVYYNPDSISYDGGIHGLFTGCNHLDSVEIGPNVRYLPSIFAGCSHITTISIPANVKSIGNYAFYGCSALSTVNLNADSLQLYNTTGEYAYKSIFANCLNFSTLNVGEGVTLLKAYAFCECSSLTNVNLPSTLNRIDYGVFKGCIGLPSINCPSAVSYIGSSAFANCESLLSFTLPNVSMINNSLFEGCSSLESIIIPNTITKIGSFAFEGCIALDSIIIPSSVRHIDWRAFAFCSNLQYVFLPSSVDTIGCGAFGHCISLTTVEYNLTNPVVTSVNYVLPASNLKFSSVFDSCVNLQTIIWGEDVSCIPSFIFEKSGIVNINIPHGIDSIGNHAFYNCTNLTSIILPNSITSIGNEAFEFCNSLNSIILPDSITTIKPWTFAYCSSLSEVKVGENVNSIENNAFRNCNNLHNIILPTSLTLIDYSAFEDCSMLDSVIIPNLVDSIGESAFANCTGLHDIFLEPTTPPAIFYMGSDSYYQDRRRTFYNVYSYMKKHIPCGTTSAYRDCWHDWTFYEPDVEFELILNTADTMIGEVSIVRELRCIDSSVVILSTTVDTHYHFSHWSNGNITNPDTIYLVSDSTVTAIYERNQYVITVQSENTTMGTVSGGGVYYYQDTAYLTATALDHYHFVKWSDGNTENPRQYIVNGHITLKASFAIDVHTVTAIAGNIAAGSISGGGDFQYGTPATIYATAYSGYQFSHWSNNCTFDPYTFAVLSDTTLIAIFQAEGSPYQDTLFVYDTIYLPQYIHDTTVIVQSDTTILAVHDTTYIVQADTVINTVHDTITTTVFDTMVVNNTDTLRLYDTVFVYDTIFIHDTIVVGVDEVDAINARVYTSQGKIVVDGAEGNVVWLYDVNGRVLATKQDDNSPIQFDVPVSGTYLVKVGNHPARKIVVVR